MDKDVNDFKKVLDSGFTVICLTGDRFGVDEGIKLIKERFNDWEVESFFPGEEERIISSITSFGIFDIKKLIFIYYPEALSQVYKKEFLNCINKYNLVNKKIVLISEKESFLKQISCRLFKFRPIYETEIEDWIAQYVLTKNCKITPDAVSMLKLFFGNDRKEIASFLESIIQSNKTIDTNTLFRFNLIRENAIFESLDYLFYRNLKNAIETFIISESENKYYALIIKELNNLIDLKVKKSIDKFQNSFIIKKILKRLERWKLEELSMAFRIFLDLEGKIKIGYNPFYLTLISIFKLLKGGKI